MLKVKSVKFFSVNFILLLVLLFIFSKRQNSGQIDHTKANPVLIDQSGYRPQDRKIALIKDCKSLDYIIKDAKTDSIVLTGRIKPVGEADKVTGDEVFELDFSQLMKPGSYYISLPSQSINSDRFEIGQNVYLDCALKTLQSFYYQRCGIEVNNGELWQHPACHTKEAAFYNDPSKHKDVSGGWHDAGDYNKFVPTTTESIAFMLYAYEKNPGLFYDGQLKIPESQNNIPDILDEAAWGLKWLIKMQREDGAVYQKVSIKKWTGEHLPDEETDEQYIFGISNSATASTAAVTALAARLFLKYDKDFTQKLLSTSTACWSYLNHNPYNTPPGGFKNPPGVEGGEYNDADDSDERLWASIELYRTTGSEEYLKYFLQNFKSIGGPNYTISWQNTANFAYYAFLKIPSVNNYFGAKEVIISNLKNYADHLLSKINLNGYRCVLGPDQFYWGSNSIDLGFAFDLVSAYEATHDKSYITGALDQLHYILGRNTFGKTFVTGVGINPVRYPYHQFSMLKYPGMPVPGMVVGGPNKNSNLNGKIISEYPGKCYEDNSKNYFVNETAINYTAPLIYIASYFSQPEQKTNNEQKLSADK